MGPAARPPKQAGRLPSVNSPPRCPVNSTARPQPNPRADYETVKASSDTRHMVRNAAPVRAGPPRRADAPGSPSSPHTLSTRRLRPHHTRPAADSRSPARSHPSTSDDAADRRSSSAHTPAARPATGTRTRPKQDPVDHHPVINPPTPLPSITRQQRTKTLPFLIRQIMTIRTLNHPTRLHQPTMKIYETRPRSPDRPYKVPKTGTLSRRKGVSSPVENRY